MSASRAHCRAMTHGEYLAWAKARALRHLDAGDLLSALVSMVGDLRWGPQRAYAPRIIAEFAGDGIPLVVSKDSSGLRKWIEAFQ